MTLGSMRSDPVDLWWPGDERAGDLMSAPALVRAMTAVEEAWLGALAAEQVAPSVAAPPPGTLAGLVGDADLPALARRAEDVGTPTAGLVDLLRERLRQRDRPDAAHWLHRGLTSQDVLDTALLLAARDAVAAVVGALRRQAATLADLAAAHRDTPQVARTLTRHAVPTTFGLTAAGWLTGILDAYDDLVAVRFPAQLGGAAGTHAALVELAGEPDVASRVLAGTAERLGLDLVSSWHTTRTPVTRLADATVRCTDAWGRLARDVLELGRPEVAEVSESAGEEGAGGSSTMPGKQNPVRAVLVRRAALAAPGLLAGIHTAAAEQVDQRADGAWHAEWAPLATLLRRTVVAAEHTADLVAGLLVHPEAMRATLDAAGDAVLAEQRAMAEVAGHDPDRAPSGPGGYLGLAPASVDDAVARARSVLAATDEAPA